MMPRSDQASGSLTPATSSMRRDQDPCPHVTSSGVIAVPVAFFKIML